MNYNLFELDARAFDFNGPLTFRYEYHKHQTLSTEVFRSPFRTRASSLSGRIYHSAIAYFHEYLETHEPEMLANFLRLAHELLGLVTFTQSAGFEYCAIPNCARLKTYAGHPIPWISCHSQGWALSIFCRAYQAAHDDRFLRAAEGLMRSFEVDVDCGGIRSRERYGHLFYEECPFPGQERHILNGFLSSLFALHEYFRLTGDSRAEAMFCEGAESLCDRVLDSFDAGFTSHYDQVTQHVSPACAFYNKAHVRELAVLHRLTGNSILRRRAERWYEYSLQWRCRVRLSSGCLGYRIRSIPRYLREVYGIFTQDQMSALHL